MRESLIKQIRLAKVENRITSSTKNDSGDWQDTWGDVSIGCVGVIRFNHYGRSWKILGEAVAEAKQDFPCLSDGDIRVVQYGGRHYAGTFGIEFDLPEDTQLPEGYESINQLEVRK